MNDEPRINLGSNTCPNMINGVGATDNSQPDYVHLREPQKVENQKKKKKI